MSSQSSYGRANREVVQDTRAGNVDPPIRETAQQAGGVQARQVRDQTLGNEGAVAEALIETAGVFGQKAVKEAHRQQRIEGAKLVADNEAVAYLNETEQTFAEKIFGNKPKRRVAEEMQVKQDVNHLDDSMRQWVDDGGFKESPEAFQAEYDRRYSEMTDKYNDDNMKDLIAASYAENLSATRAGHQKSKHLYDQQLLRSTAMKGWGEASERYREDSASNDPAVRDAALDKMFTALQKHPDMSQSAYKDAMYDFAIDELARHNPDVYAMAEEEGVFEDLTFEQENTLRDMLEVNQINNDRDFNTQSQQLHRYAADGNAAAVAQLGAELQRQNPQAVPSLNRIINEAEAVAESRRMAIAENQRDRMRKADLYRQGGAAAASLSSEDRALAEADVAQQLKEEYALQNRKELRDASEDGNYPEGHPREGTPIPSTNDPITSMEFDDLNNNLAYDEAARLQWMKSDDPNNIAMSTDIARYRQLSSMSKTALDSDPALLDELGFLIERFTAYEDTFGGADLFRESFDNEDDYNEFQRLRNVVDMGLPLGSALEDEKVWATRRANDLTTPEERERANNKRKKSIGREFRKQHQDRKWYKLGGRRAIANDDQLDAYAEELFDTNLRFYQGDADRAANATMFQLSKQGGTVNNKFIPDSGNYLEQQAELTPDRSMEDLIALRFSDPDELRRLEQAGYPGIVTWENKLGKWLPRLNFNTGKAQRANYTMVGENMVISLPGGEGGRDYTMTIPPTTEEEAASMTTRMQNTRDAARGIATTTHDTYKKAQDLAVQNNELARLQLQRSRLDKEVNGNAAQKLAGAAGEVLDGVGTSVSKKTTAVKKRATELGAASGEAIGTAVDFVADAAREASYETFSNEISREELERYIHIPAQSQSIIEQQQKDQIQQIRDEIAELEAKRAAN